MKLETRKLNLAIMASFVCYVLVRSCLIVVASSAKMNSGNKHASYVVVTALFQICLPGA